MADCIFCKIAAGEVRSEIVFQDETYVAFRDIRPQAPVHIQIIPIRHIPKISDLTEKDQDLTGGMVALANRLAAEEGIAEGGYRLVFNCGANAGQEVFHIHLHLLGGRPFRWPPG